MIEGDELFFNPPEPIYDTRDGANLQFEMHEKFHGIANVISLLKKEHYNEWCPPN